MRDLADFVEIKDLNDINLTRSSSKAPRLLIDLLA